MRPKAIDVKVLNNYELEILFNNNERYLMLNHILNLKFLKN